jgi:hypothetical protein
MTGGIEEGRRGGEDADTVIRSASANFIAKNNSQRSQSLGAEATYMLGLQKFPPKSFQSKAEQHKNYHFNINSNMFNGPVYKKFHTTGFLKFGPIMKKAQDLISLI